MSIKVEFNFSSYVQLKEFSKLSNAESSSQTVSDVVLRVLVDLFRTAQQKTAQEQYVISSRMVLNVRDELLLYLSQSKCSDSKRLKEQIILSVQNILEGRSPLYKAERLLRSLDPAKPIGKETVNFLAQTMFDVIVERSNVMKLYEHVMTRLFLSCIQEDMQRSDNCFMHNNQGDLILDHSKLPQMTAEGFCVAARLEHAKKMKVNKLQNELAIIIKEQNGLETSSVPLIEFWKKLYLLNIQQSIATVFEARFKDTVLHSKVEFKIIANELAKKSQQNESKDGLSLARSLLLSSERTTFCSEEVESITAAYCQAVMQPLNLGVKEAVVNQRERLQRLAGQVIELGQMLNRRMKEFEPVYIQLWELLSGSIGKHAETTAPSKFASHVVPEIGITDFVQKAKSFVEPSELSKLCLGGSDAIFTACMTTIYPDRPFVLPPKEETASQALEETLIKPLENCTITSKPAKAASKAKPKRAQVLVETQDLRPQAAAAPVPQLKVRRIKKPALIALHPSGVLLAKRVSDWFRSEPVMWQKEPYVQRSQVSREESKFLHTYPIIITKLMRQYCTAEQYNQDTLYTCPGKIELYGDEAVVYEGYFADCFGVKSGELYHHFFHKRSFQRLIEGYAEEFSFIEQEDEQELNLAAQQAEKGAEIVDTLEVNNRFVIVKKRYLLEVDDTEKKVRYSLCFPEGLR